MIKSMTGFGRIQLRRGQNNWIFELRSLNHRFFEYSARLQEALNPFENDIRDWIEAKVPRGKVTLFITSNGGGTELERVSIDEKKAEFYCKSVKKIAHRLGLDDRLALSDILKLPNIFLVEKKTVPFPGFREFIRKGVEAALRELLKMKIREGKALRKDLTARISEIREALSNIRREAGKTAAQYERRLKTRVSQLAEGISLDAEKLAREVALMADRADISEEIVRLESHLGLFQSSLNREGPIGKKLDFIVQELNRETTTIGAKSMSVAISNEVIRMKSELEKIREQIQNIE
ncbi:MAG TPA: YicC family protein [Candidatus Omnitrophota bacterium]|nr:YicC family protein [Candidatus Omnitrophota bacterium]